MLMSDTQETTDSEGMTNLREAYERANERAAAAERRAAFAELGVKPNDAQVTAMNAVLDGDWSNPETVGKAYGDLFGTPTAPTPQPEPQPTQQNEPDMSGETVETAPTPPGGAILDNVTAMTSGGTTPPGEPVAEDPVEVGYQEYRADINSGRRKADASAQVINRLIDRGAKGMPGGVYDHDAYQEALNEGRVGTTPAARLVE